MVKTENGVEILDEFAWEEVETLRPGVDLKHGVSYVTIPVRLNVVKTIGRGKNEKEVVVQEEGIGCITSEGKHFAYTPERVAEFGFQYPATVAKPEESRWSMKSVQEFLKGEYTKPNPVNIYTALKNVYEQHVEFAHPAYYDMMTMFLMSSYMFRTFSSIGYVHFNGTAASGKSVNLSIIKALAFNTMWASNMSTPSLFRTIAGNPGTMALDEAEGFDGERGEELRRILNAGYLDGSSVARTEKGPNDGFIVRQYEVYGPKAIASINPLEPVIGSRCVVVAMRPAIRERMPEFNKDAERWQALRDRLYLWLITEQAAFRELVKEWTETIRWERAPGLRARHWQITQAYIVTADYLDRIDGGTRCNDLITFFTEYFIEAQKSLDASDRIRLVLRTLPRVLGTVFPHDEHWYPLKSIHETVSTYLEEDQKEYFRTRTLGKHLDVLGFKKRRAHKAGQQVWLEADQIRNEFKQRRVEAYPEDTEWLEGKTEYIVQEHTVVEYTRDKDDIWASAEDEEWNG